MNYKTDLEQLFHEAKHIFCNGIYIKSNMHPCGWDFISFEDFEVFQDLYDQSISLDSISGGCYESHDYEDLTISDIFEIIGDDGWCYEIDNVNQLK